MTKLTCSIPDCVKPVMGRGWCSMHYNRWYKNGGSENVFKPQLACSIEGCERKHEARGYCGMHYGRLKKTGTTEPPKVPSLAERLWSKVRKTESCWEWTAGKNAGGYGIIKGEPGGSKLAHRIAWELEFGHLPASDFLDHICHNRGCVRPSHLRVVNVSENNQHRSQRSKQARSGYRGVHWHKGAGRWRARVKFAGQEYHLGLFDSAEEAQEAVRLKRLEVFTHNELDRAPISATN